MLFNSQFFPLTSERLQFSSGLQEPSRYFSQCQQCCVLWMILIILLIFNNCRLSSKHCGTILRAPITIAIQFHIFFFSGKVQWFVFIIILFGIFFKAVLADSLSLEYEYKKISSGLQDVFQILSDLKKKNAVVFDYINSSSKITTLPSTSPSPWGAFQTCQLE